MLVGSLSFIIHDIGRKKEMHLHIYSGRRGCGITEAVQMGKANLPPTDPFNDLDPLVPSTQETQEFNSVIAVQE